MNIGKVVKRHVHQLHYRFEEDSTLVGDVHVHVVPVIHVCPSGSSPAPDDNIVKLQTVSTQLFLSSLSLQNKHPSSLSTYCVVVRLSLQNKHAPLIFKHALRCGSLSLKNKHPSSLSTYCVVAPYR